MALVISDVRNPFFAELARGAEDAAYRAGCELILCNSDLHPEKQMQYVRSLISKRVDGIVMNSIAPLTAAASQPWKSIMSSSTRISPCFRTIYSTIGTKRS